MRLPLLLLVFLLAGKTALAQMVPSSCTPSAQLLQSYKNDVADLALQRLYEINSPDTALVEIPQSYQDTIWQALSAVANTGAILEADSVFRNYCLHRWPYRHFQGFSIDLKVDTSYAWVKQWRLGNTPTGNGAIDSFMARHGVLFQRYVGNFPDSNLNHRATLVISRPINIRAFTDSMMKFPGALQGYVQGYGGDGGNVFYTKDSSIAYLQFKAAWGDCPAGCSSWKRWYYSVNLNTCTVSLDSIKKFRADEPIEDFFRPNCNGWPLQMTKALPVGNSPLTLFPNPATTILGLQGGAGGPLTYRISDVSGRSVLAGKCTDHTIEIAALPAGFYVLIVWEANGQVHNRKFVKN